MSNEIILETCAFCGATDCAAHKKYVDRCDNCGSRYARFTSYRSTYRKKPTAKLERLLIDLSTEYTQLKQLGFKTPKDLTF